MDSSHRIEACTQEIQRVHLRHIEVRGSQILRQSCAERNVFVDGIPCHVACVLCAATRVPLCGMPLCHDEQSCSS